MEQSGSHRTLGDLYLESAEQMGGAGMNLNDQDERNNQSGDDSRSNQTEYGSLHGSNDPYGKYIPQEIPIPDMNRGENSAYQVQNPNAPYGQNNAYSTQNTEAAYGPAAQMYTQKQKKDSGVKILIAVAGVIAMIFVFVGIGMAYFKSTPVYKFSKAFLNLSKEIEQTKNPLVEKIGIGDLLLLTTEGNSHVSTQMNFTSEGLFGTTFGIDTDCYKDMDHKELSADTSISVMNYDFAHLNIYADDEDFCFSIPELFVENMYIHNENVVSQYNHSFLAELTGESDAEDFSLNFFADPEEKLSLREWQNLDAFSERFAEDIQACRDKLIMEKVEKGVYRIVYPEKEMDRLLQDMMENYEAIYEAVGEDPWWKEYDSLIDSDISILFEISGQNRIESITFERPVKMLDSMASMEASLYFMGGAGSIDKIQGEITAEGVDGTERAIHFQTVLTSSEDIYEFNMDAEFMEERDSQLRVKYTVDSDAVRDEFGMNFSVWNDEQDIEVILEGSLDDIVRGRSLELDLDELTFNMDGEALFKVTGEMLIEPFDGEVTSTVQKKHAFFEMTEDDWLDILYKIDDEYGGMLNYLW